MIGGNRGNVANKPTMVENTHIIGGISPSVASKA